MQYDLPNGPEKAEHDAHWCHKGSLETAGHKGHGANRVWRDPCLWETHTLYMGGETNRKGDTKSCILEKPPNFPVIRGTITVRWSPPQNPPSIVTKTNHEQEHLRRTLSGPLRDTAAPLRTTWSFQLSFAGGLPGDPRAAVATSSNPSSASELTST